MHPNVYVYAWMYVYNVKNSKNKEVSDQLPSGLNSKQGYMTPADFRESNETFWTSFRLRKVMMMMTTENPSKIRVLSCVFNLEF